MRVSSNVDNCALTTLRAPFATLLLPSHPGRREGIGMPVRLGSSYAHTQYLHSDWSQFHFVVSTFKTQRRSWAMDENLDGVEACGLLLLAG